MITFPTWILATICSAFMITPVAMTTFCKGEKGKKINKIASIIGFTLYAGLTALLTLTESSVDFYKTVINFTASSEWLSKVFSMSFYNNTFHTIENLAMLMPLGAMTTQNQKANGKSLSILKSLGIGLLAGGAIEAMQFILPINREPDVFDIMMNTLSCGFGATATVATVALKDKISNFAKNKSEKTIEDEKSKQLGKEKTYEIGYEFNKEKSLTPDSGSIKYTTSLNNMSLSETENTFEFVRPYDYVGNKGAEKLETKKFANSTNQKSKENNFSLSFDEEEDEQKIHKSEWVGHFKRVRPLKNSLLRQMNLTQRNLPYSADIDEKSR